MWANTWDNKFLEVLIRNLISKEFKFQQPKKSQAPSPEPWPVGMVLAIIMAGLISVEIWSPTQI